LHGNNLKKQNLYDFAIGHTELKKKQCFFTRQLMP